MDVEDLLVRFLTENKEDTTLVDGVGDDVDRRLAMTEFFNVLWAHTYRERKREP
jgi:hypothetical protein